MATTQQLLSAINGLQENAQSNVPVIPNNGNPGGAYNVASAESPTAGLPSNPNPLAWLEPSEYMQNIKQLLQYQAQQLLRQAEQPAEKGNFNLVVKDGGFGLQLLTDDNIPLDSTLPTLPLNLDPRPTNPDDIVLPEDFQPQPGTEYIM